MPLERKLTTARPDLLALLRAVHELDKNVADGVGCRADDRKLLHMAGHLAADLLDPRRPQIADRRLAEHHRLANVGSEPTDGPHVADYVGLELVVANLRVRHVRDVHELDIASLRP